MNLQRVFHNNLADLPGKNLNDLKGAAADRHEKTEAPRFATAKVYLALTEGVKQLNALVWHVHGPPSGFFNLVRGSTGGVTFCSILVRFTKASILPTPSLTRSQAGAGTALALVNRVRRAWHEQPADPPWQSLP